MTKKLKQKYSGKKIIFYGSKIAVYLSLSFNEGRLWGSLLSLKENIQHFKK
jgi:hypothetical protein